MANGVANVIQMKAPICRTCGEAHWERVCPEGLRGRKGAAEAVAGPRETSLGEKSDVGKKAESSPTYRYRDREKRREYMRF